MAKNLLDVLDLETIALKSGLTLEEVQQLKDAERKSATRSKPHGLLDGS
jgi:hypothetical protein